MPENLVNKSIFQGRFILTRLLGKGGFGEVYAAIQTSNNEVVAVKLEKNTGKNSFLFHEARVMQDIQKNRTEDGIAGIATLKYFGQEGDYRMLIMSIHGPSLEDLHERLGSFSLKTTVMLAVQMMYRIEYVHSAGFVHRDLKTDNFITGKNVNSPRIYLIDFGLSSRYLGTDGEHREMQRGKCFLGTSRFASLRTHQGLSQSRRDDIEQIVYIMIYMYRGRLPWSGLNLKNPEEKETRIGKIKGELSISEICAKCPHQFEELLYYARNIGFKEAPNYEMLRTYLRAVLEDMKPPETLDYIFDWDTRLVKPPAHTTSPTPTPNIIPATHSNDGAVKGAPNILSDAKADGFFSGFGSSNPPKNVFSIGERD